MGVRQCECGSEWFVIERLIKVMEIPGTSVARGAEPPVADVEIQLRCAKCGRTSSAER